jgi:phosphonate transport system substrate-binding protein
MKLVRTSVATLLASLLLAGQAFAQFTLDSRFTDADGDLIADIPTDESQLVDPDTLIFAYTPVEDPAVYAEVWQGFLEHMEEVTGKSVQFFPVQSNAAQLEAMRAGRLHVAGFNTGSNPIAVACAGFRPFAMMAAADGSFGYEMEIITYPDSGIESVEDIKGKQMAFTQETSNSGFKAPSALLKSEFGMEAGADYEAGGEVRPALGEIRDRQRRDDHAEVGGEIPARLLPYPAHVAVAVAEGAQPPGGDQVDRQ